MELPALGREAAVSLTAEARHDFAVVIPAFNEAPVVPALISELRATFERHELSGEVLFVDDGSTDGTADLIWSCSTRISSICPTRFHGFSRNCTPDGIL